MEGSRGQPGKAQRPAWKGIVGPQRGPPPRAQEPSIGLPPLSPSCLFSSEPRPRPPRSLVYELGVALHWASDLSLIIFEASQRGQGTRLVGPGLAWPLSPPCSDLAPAVPLEGGFPPARGM